jgi:hypothetical protein
MKERMRDRAITIRMLDEEVSMLRQLSIASGLSQSDIVRQSIRKAHAELEQQPKKKAPRR